MKSQGADSRVLHSLMHADIDALHIWMHSYIDVS
jgi:hypothetical protein